MQIANEKRKTIVCGIGINDADYSTQTRVNGKVTTCPYYDTWRGMLKRCYSEAYLAKYPSYKGCSVVPEWLSFMAFRSWMMSQDWKGKHMDKDILEIGNRVYSPDKCVFVSQSTNNLLSNRKILNPDSAYREAKRLRILTVACCEPDVCVKQGLYRHSERFR